MVIILHDSPALDRVWQPCILFLFEWHGFLFSKNLPPLLIANRCPERLVFLVSDVFWHFVNRMAMSDMFQLLCPWISTLRPSPYSCRSQPKHQDQQAAQNLFERKKKRNQF